MTKAYVGSISHGTLRQPDLLNAFADTLASFDRTFDDSEAKALATLLEIDSDYCAGLTDIAAEVLNDMDARLQEYAPPYCYFGASEGDGSDFGFWPNMEAIEDLPRVQNVDGEELPDEDHAYVNDHGNVTVYSADGSVILELV